MLATHVIAIDGYAGRRYHPVAIAGFTKARTRVVVMSPGGVRMPGGRHVGFGETTLVPRWAVIAREKS